MSNLSRIAGILFIFFLVSNIAFAQESDGKKYELVKIAFTGNSTFSEGVLKSKIISQETPLWIWKFLNKFSALGRPPELFDSLRIKSDVRALREFYNTNGFFETSIKASIEKNTNDLEVILTYNIVEGTASLFGKARVEGIKSIHRELRDEVEKLFELDTTVRYNEAIIRGKIEQSLQLYENNGYMFARFDSTVIIKDTARRRADISIHFNTGGRLKIQELVIDKKGEGAYDVDIELLKRIVGIDKEEYYSLEKIRLSQIRLYRTGLFNSVVISPLTSDTSSGHVPILVSCNVGMLHEVSPEILMNNQQNTFNIGLGATIIRKNFLGEARKLTIAGSGGVQDFFTISPAKLIKGLNFRDSSFYGFIDGTARIEQPYVFNRPVFGILEGYFRLYKDLYSNKRNYGGKLSFEFELPSYTFINFLTAFYNFEVADELFSGVSGVKMLNNTLSVFGADMKSTKTDDPLYPTRGYNLSLVVEEANSLTYAVSKLINPDFKEPLFYKVMGTIGLYSPLRENSTAVGGLKLKAGHLQSFSGDANEVPSTRKFFAGGSNSLRGWRARELAPTKIISINNEEVILSGGNFIFETSLEFRYRTKSDFGFVGFVDAGNTWSDYTKFRFRDFSVASGIGLRYYTVIAPFRIDFGIKTYDPASTKKIFERPFLKELFEFHFGIGEAF
ncbi:MAG: BamA/TamA family outer membrane protein [Ignavibacteriaceae bacterium]|nr:BamA/TamA family outer membrane protein [Ignavibacteriaceae bacterium]